MWKRLRRFLRIAGPGVVTGAADDDPSGVATYSQAGAQFGYAQLWLIPVMLPMMVAIQEMCARIGLVTGHGIAGGVLINFIGINPIKALIYTAVINGVVAVPLILLLLLIGNNRRIMGEFVNGRFANISGWTTFGVMGLAVLMAVSRAM